MDAATGAAEMTITLSEREWLTAALAAIEPIKTDEELVQWMDEWMAGEEYLRLPDAASKQLDEAYTNKVAWIWGMGGG